MSKKKGKRLETSEAFEATTAGSAGIDTPSASGAASGSELAMTSPPVSELNNADSTGVYRVPNPRDPMNGNPAPLHGIMVEFDDSDTLLAAANSAREAGYKDMDSYTPIPVEGLTAAMGWRDSTMPKIMLTGGIIGSLTGLSIQYFSNVYYYPLNIGGKPPNSWPMFIVIIFELTVLFTALSGVFGMFALNGLPNPYHPVFNAPGFEAASTDKFYLCIESRDPQFDREATLNFMRGLGGRRVIEVAP